MDFMILQNVEIWGQARLFSIETWPGTIRVERELLADQVVDLFHAKAVAAGLPVRWRPNVPGLETAGELEGGLEDHYPALLKLLGEAYTEVRQDLETGEDVGASVAASKRRVGAVYAELRKALPLPPPARRGGGA